MDEKLQSTFRTRDEILARIRALLINQLHIRKDPDEIDPDTPLFGGGLALDSIDSVDLLIHMKSEFGVELPDDRAGRASLRTVNSLVDLVLQQSEGVNRDPE
jgi:acyl carrier protein